MNRLQFRWQILLMSALLTAVLVYAGQRPFPPAAPQTAAASARLNLCSQRPLSKPWMQVYLHTAFQ